MPRPRGTLRSIVIYGGIFVIAIQSVLLFEKFTRDPEVEARPWPSFAPKNQECVCRDKLRKFSSRLASFDLAHDRSPELAAVLDSLEELHKCRFWMQDDDLRGAIINLVFSANEVSSDLDPNTYKLGPEKFDKYYRRSVDRMEGHLDRALELADEACRIPK